MHYADKEIADWLAPVVKAEKAMWLQKARAMLEKQQGEKQ